MLTRKNTHYIVIHCSATRADQVCTAADIRRWHVDERGWSDIGYHWIVERDGKVVPGRKSDSWGAHVRGHNHDSVGICLVGGIDSKGQPENNFTQQQMLALEMLVESLQFRYPVALVKGHCDFDSRKHCPCFDVAEWLEDIL